MIADQVVQKYIEENPDQPGAADARLIEEGVPVWALIGHLPAVDGHPHKVAMDYGISDESMEAVMAFYQQHKCEIDARIAANAIPA